MSFYFVTLKNQIRIIGGQWRGRKITFLPEKNLRPTLDRIRETLFNWLAPVIWQSSCLDLFAGSGALGFEALSRGAKEMIFIENNKASYDQLITNSKILQCKNANFYLLQAENFLLNTENKFNIIFLDPPFGENIITHICSLILEKKILLTNGYLYIESELSDFKLPKELVLLKEKKAGNVHYFLFTLT